MTNRVTRHDIADYLAKNGAVEDSAGRATLALEKAIGYDGSSTGFSQLIAAMGRAGELTREVKGKRTYRIALPTATGFGPERETSNHETVIEGPRALDYDHLAAELLDRVTQTMAAVNDQRRGDGSWARRRIDRLEHRNEELERQLARTRGELRSIGDERDQLQRALEHSESNLSILTDQLSATRSSGDRPSNRLGADDRALLDRLRPSAHTRSHRAS